LTIAGRNPAIKIAFFMPQIRSINDPTISLSGRNKVLWRMIDIKNQFLKLSRKKRGVSKRLPP